MLEWIFWIAVLLLSVTAFSAITAVRARKAKTGFMFFGFTIGIQILAVIITCFFIRYMSDAFCIIAFVLNAAAVFGITYYFVPARIFPRKEKKNLIFSVSYSIVTSVSVMCCTAVIFMMLGGFD